MIAKSKRERPCILVIDANILIQDFWLEGSSWSYLLKRSFISHKLAIPRIALDEATANIERRANELLDRISKSGVTPKLESQYQHLFNRKRVGKESALGLSKRYRRFIQKSVQTHQGLNLDPPDAPLPLLLERSISRRKPFSQGDRGFRDTLIWLNTVQLVRDYERVSFVSANTNDYAHDESLHPDLEADLAPVLPEHLHFRYFKSLHEFIAFMDRDGSAGAEALRNALMSEGYGSFKLEHWILENIDDLLRDSELDGISWTALPYWAEDPRLVDLEELIGIEVHGERSLEHDRVEFFCDLSLVGIFQCSILFGSWKNIVHPRQVEWVD
jgi:PIN domain